MTSSQDDTAQGSKSGKTAFPFFASLSRVPGIGWIFATDPYPRRWECGDWAPGIGWLHIISDVLIWLAYLMIPIVLVYFLNKREKRIPFSGIIVLFAAFILLCGTTHIIEAIIFWIPIYGIAGLVKLVTAIVSVATVIALVGVLPQAIKLRSAKELEEEVQERTKQLEEARVLASSIVDSSPVGKVIVDRDREVLLVNPAFEEIFECAGKDDIAEILDFILPIDSCQRWFAGDTDNVGRTTRLHCPRKTGEEVIVEITHTILPNSERPMMLLTVNNITDLEKGIEAIRRLASVVKNTQDEMVWLNLDGTVSSWNQGATELYGFDSDEMVGQPFAKSFTPENREQVTELLRRLLTGEQINQLETERLTRSGEIVTVILNIAPIRDSSQEIIGVSVIGHDITERKKLEQARIQLNEELEARVEQRTFELARSNKELEDFAYVASHDLQEPLRKISSYCQLLLEEEGDKLEEDGKGYLEIAINGATRLRSLIKDLLAFSRITTRGNPLVPTDSGECLNSVLSDLEMVLKEKNATVEFGELPTVIADSSQLARLFQNLVSNALKYQQSKQPKVDIRVKEKKDHFEFSVTDNGIGIAEEFYDRIFGIFQRLHNRKQYSGTGIGLAICKRIVERFGGHIWVTSKEGEGSTFSFTLKKPT